MIERNTFSKLLRSRFVTAQKINVMILFILKRLEIVAKGPKGTKTEQSKRRLLRSLFLILSNLDQIGIQLGVMAMEHATNLCAKMMIVKMSS